VTTTTQAPAFGLPQLMRLLLLGTIVAPTTLLTSLLFYFGWSHAYRFYDYFGVNSTLLDLTTQDYLMRALDGLFVPMTVVALAGLVALWGHTALRARLAAGSRPRVLRILGPVMAIAGLALAIGGVSSVFTETALHDQLAAAPVSLAVGVLLPVYALHLRRFSAADQGRAGPPAGPGWAAVAGVGGRVRARGSEPVLGRLPLPLRRPEARAAIREAVPVPFRGMDLHRRRRHPHARQRLATPGVRPGIRPRHRAALHLSASPG
jgi:hypothetical protein